MLVALLPTQQLEVMRAIVDAGIPADEFVWTNDSLSLQVDSIRQLKRPFPADVVTHRPTDGAVLFCAFSTAMGQQIETRWTPGADRVTDRARFGWDDVVNHVVLPWLDNMRREHVASDALGELLRASVSVAAVTADAVDPAGGPAFTTSERGALNAKLDAILREARENQLTTSAHLARLDREIAGLRAALDRVGKGDWARMALGALVSWAVAAALPPEPARKWIERVIGEIGAVVRQRLLGG